MSTKCDETNPGNGWELLPDGALLRSGDGFWHADTGYWIDFDCRPDLFRGDREFVHSGWPWRRNRNGSATDKKDSALHKAVELVAA